MCGDTHVPMPVYFLSGKLRANSRLLIQLLRERKGFRMLPQKELGAEREPEVLPFCDFEPYSHHRATGHHRANRSGEGLKLTCYVSLGWILTSVFCFPICMKVGLDNP